MDFEGVEQCVVSSPAFPSPSLPSVISFRLSQQRSLALRKSRRLLPQTLLLSNRLVKLSQNKTKNELRDSPPAADEDPLFSFGCFYADCELCPLARHDCKTGAIIPFDGTEDPPTLSTDNGNVLDTLAKRGDCFYIYGGVVCPKLKRVDGKSATCSSSSNLPISGHREGRKEGVGLLAQSPFPFPGHRSRPGRRDEGNYTATLDPGEGNFTAAMDPGDVSMGLTPPGTFSPCGKWYLVTGADHVAGCAGIAALYGLSIESLRALNTDINAGCTNLRLGYRYCLARKFSFPASFRMNETDQWDGQLRRIHL